MILEVIELEVTMKAQVIVEQVGQTVAEEVQGAIDSILSLLPYRESSGATWVVSLGQPVQFQAPVVVAERGERWSQG